MAVCRPQKNALEKVICSNEEVILETDVYFEVKDKSFYKKKSIKLFEKRWNQCITLEGDYVDGSSRILPKKLLLY